MLKYLLISLVFFNTCLGGIGFFNICTPANIGSIQGWWKANAITNAHNTLLTNWFDSSGNNRTAVAPGGFEPTFLTNLFGSRAGVKFTSDNTSAPSTLLDFAGSLANAITTTGDWTIFCVHISNATGTSNQQSCIVGNAYVGGTRLLSLTSANSFFTASDEGVVDEDQSTTVSSTTGQALCSVSGSWGGKSAFYENKVNRTTSNQTYGTMKVTDIGGCARPQGNRLSGAVGEVVIMFKQPSVSQILSLYNSYFRPKFPILP